MRMDLIAGARPNFMKIAAIIEAAHQAQANGADITYRLVHTGQHYDRNMSGSFFEQLGIPEPHENLGAGGGTQAEQTAAIMTGYEKLLFRSKPDVCVVVGDVTSTMACAITAQKSHVPVAHVEGGIRSGDWTMPEEINRLVTDSITNWFFTTSEVANANLKRSGIREEQIFFVGNTMIDTLLRHRPRFQEPALWQRHQLRNQQYLVMTLHRPANVDEAGNLRELIHEVMQHSADLPVVFPVHPRTAKMLDAAGISHPRLLFAEPLPYLEFNFLVERSKAVITDSGGITEETTVMGIPCLTLRDSTERPETVETGTNELIGTDPRAIAPALQKVIRGEWKRGGIPKKWDGRTGERIINTLQQLFP